MTKKITIAYYLFLVYSVLMGVGGNLFILGQFRFFIILHKFSLFCFVFFLGFGEQVDLECSDGRNAVGVFSHRRLSV